MDPIFPIDYIGPATTGPGSISVEEAKEEELTEIPGEEIKPSPMLPPEIDLSEKQRGRLALYLSRELDICESERFEYVSKLARLKEKYRTKFPEFPKDFPMANSSQLVVPVIKTAVNTLSARMHQTVMAAEPLASFRTKNLELQDTSNDLEEFVKQYNEDLLDIEEILDDVVTETIKLGTAVVECTHLVEKRKVVTYDSLGVRYNQSTQTIHSGPKFYHIPLADFWIRPNYQDIQEAPWCGKELRLYWSQIKNMALSGILNPEQINNIWRFRQQGNADVPETQRVDEKIEDLEPHERDEFTVYELAVRWDVDGDGIDEELMVYYHRPSRTILRVRFNTFTNGRRPWIVFRYIKIPHRFYAEGLAEMLEHLQEEISTIHNQRIDNASIANLKIILVSKFIKGLSPGDRLWSGKVVKVTDVAKDVNTVSLGDPYRSTVQDEGISQQYVREVSGIGEVATGQAQPVSRTTATAQLSLLEELNRRFDKILKGFRRSIREMHRHELDIFIQYGTNGLAATWLGEVAGQRIEDFLQQPGDYIRNHIKVRTLATKATVNREVEFQSNIAVMNLVISMGQQMMALTQQLAPQATAVIAHELVSTIRPVFKKVMQYADAPSADQAISVLNVLERVLPPPESLGIVPAQSPLAAGQGAPGADGGVAGTAGQSQNGQGVSGNPGIGGMEDILAAFGQGNVPNARMAQRGRNGR